MSLNLVIPNKDNLVKMIFDGVDLSLASNIVIEFGSEEYSTANDPLLIKVIDSTELTLNLSSTQEKGQIYPVVTYFDSGSVNGTDITSRELCNLSQIIVAIGTQLIIEDGSIVEDANSFVSDDEYKKFASLKGFSLPCTQPEREAQLANAYDFMNFTYEPRLDGERVSPQVQTGCMPRKYMSAFNECIASDYIPKDFKSAQMLVALSINDGVQTNAVKESADLAGFSVGNGAYSETYQTNSMSPTLAQMPAVTRLLKPYSKSQGIHRENMGYLF